MNEIKFLELDDLIKIYNSRGQLRKGIKKINLQYPHPIIITESEEDFILKLNWKYNLGVTELLGIYREVGTWGNFSVYYK